MLAFKGRLKSELWQACPKNVLTRDKEVRRFAYKSQEVINTFFGG